jgi:hypothetical protein
MEAEKAPAAEVVGLSEPEWVIQESESPFPQLSISSEKTFQRFLEHLGRTSTIENDERKQVEFAGEDKELFITLFKKAYRAINNMAHSIYEVGRVLVEVRDILKPKGLFVAWACYAGLPTSTIYSYVTLHDRYQEELPQFSHLGVKKLLAISRLDDCISYVKQNERDLELKSANQVAREVREKLQVAKKAKASGRKPRFERFEGYIIRSSGDGTKVVVENLTKDAQKKLVQAIKDALSQINQ